MSYDDLQEVIDAETSNNSPSGLAYIAVRHMTPQPIEQEVQQGA